MIKEVDFQKTTESAFLAYAASVAQERAIPDVRDMLKIGLRQGLYAQYSNKLTYKDKFQKAQKSVAAAMTQSYVHGDAAMYDTFIRAARPWSYRYPLEAVQGNFGNPTSPDSHAAARYVEMKAAEISDILFDGLKKNAIGNEYYSNYDDTEMIPSVFPSIGFWNIVNGCSGIAVAMATSCPQFNLKEVNEALIKIIQNPDINFNDIYCAPDFACGGTITNARAIKESLKYGKGESIRLRATLNYFPDQNMIQATELPYGVFTNTVIDQLASLTEENPMYGIEKVVDHTKKSADIRIYLTKGTNPKKMIEKLYKDTALENWFSINMILLDQGRFPKVFGWREACDAYIKHIRECERNIIQFDLDKALARKNIVDGLIKACSIIDQIVSTIRSCSNPDEAKNHLIDDFKFNEEQAKAILAMKLSALTRLDIVKLNNEQAELVEKINWCQHLLNDSIALDEELIKILREVADKFGDDRRTQILDIKDDESEESIQEQDVNVLLFDNNSIRIVEKDNLLSGKRGNKGTNVKPPKGATLLKTLYCTNLSTITAFTNNGIMYTFSIHELDLNKDYSLYEIIPIKNNENVILLIDTTMLSSYKYLITVTKNGYVKKSSIQDYHVHAKKGTAALKLEENDILINVLLSSNDDDDLFICSNVGNYNYYSINELSCVGRVTRGVNGIKLSDNNYVIGADLIKNNLSYKGILSISSTGQGKISPLEEYAKTARRVKGIQIMDTKGEEVAAINAIIEDQKQLFVFTNNKLVTIKIDELPIQNRITSGIKIIDTKNIPANIEIAMR